MIQQYVAFLLFSTALSAPLNAVVVDDGHRGALSGFGIGPTVGGKEHDHSMVGEERMAILRCVYDRTKDAETAQENYGPVREKRQESENILKTQIKKTGLSDVPLDGLDDFFRQDSFLRRVTQDDVETYGNFSAAIYGVSEDDHKKEQTWASADGAKYDREINDIYDQIDVLEKRQKEMTKRSKTAKNVLDLLRIESQNLRALGVSFGAEDPLTFDLMTQKIRQKIGDLQKNLDALNRQSKIEKTKYLNGAKDLFSANLRGKDYEVAGVFHRNNGEFSGAALYEQDKNKLVLSFAGSKSVLDWVKNLFGWNQKLSSKHGLLQNISFHSGFGSHLDDNAESFFAFMRTWLVDFKKQHPGETLELVGVGHSLGGALAEIFTAAAKQIAESMDIPVKVGVMTFGAPHIVNANSLENYNAIMGGGMNTMRFEQGFDPVPKAVFWKTASGPSIQRDVSLFQDVNGTMMLPINLNPHSAEEYYHSASKVFSLWKRDYEQAADAYKRYAADRAAELEIVNTVKTGIIQSGKAGQKNSAALFNMIVGFDKANQKELKFGAFDYALQKEAEKLDSLKNQYRAEVRTLNLDAMTPRQKSAAIDTLLALNGQIKSQEDFLDFLAKYGGLTINPEDERTLDNNLKSLIELNALDIQMCLTNG